MTLLTHKNTRSLMKATFAFISIVVIYGGGVGVARSAQTSLAAGVESFQWEEFDPSGGSRLVNEHGWRNFVEARVNARLNSDWGFGAIGRLMDGDVRYDGHLTDGTPHSTTTLYQGGRGEILFSGNLQHTDTGTATLDVGLGIERWSRTVDSAYGYTENYKVFFGRLGLRYLGSEGWNLQGGFLLPFRVDEYAGLYDGFHLRPQGRTSLYGAIGYQFTENWEARLDLHTYRFDKSPPVYAYFNRALIGAYVQPESHQTSISVAIAYHF